MKRFIFCFVLCVLMFGVKLSYAAPFLACDVPEALPEVYILVLNDGTEIETPAPLHYDLKDLAPGQYVVTAKAKTGVWSSEPSVPLDFTKPLLISPTLFIQEQ